jgi:hypothetical protein
LTAQLATDTSVRADTVVAPRYDCRRVPIRVPQLTDNEQQAHVRIGRRVAELKLDQLFAVGRMAGVE